MYPKLPTLPKSWPRDMMFLAVMVSSPPSFNFTVTLAKWLKMHESWNPSWRTPYEEDVFQKNKRKAVERSENTLYDSTQWRSPRRWVWPSELPEALEVSDLTPRPNVPCCHAAMSYPAPVLPVPPVPCLSWRGPQYLRSSKQNWGRPHGVVEPDRPPVSFLTAVFLFSIILEKSQERLPLAKVQWNGGQDSVYSVYSVHLSPL